MTIYGYAYTTEDKDYLAEQLENIGTFGCDTVILEPAAQDSGSLPHKELDMLLDKVTAGDQIVIYQLVCLGKSVIQLADLLVELKEKEVALKILKKDPVLAQLDEDVYLYMLEKIAQMEKTIIRERTSRGLEEARRHGRIGGRPKISQETVERIRFLYHNNKYTLRQIAEECNISLGTAYKYIQE